MAHRRAAPRAALAASGDEDGPGAGDGGLVAGEGASDSSSGSIFIASRAASCDDSPHALILAFWTTSIVRYLRVQLFKELQSKTLLMTRLARSTSLLSFSSLTRMRQPPLLIKTSSRPHLLG